MSPLPLGILASARAALAAIKAFFITKNPKIYTVSQNLSALEAVNSPVTLNSLKHVSSSKSGLANDTYLVGGNSGYVYRSVDGLTWTTGNINTTQNINAVDLIESASIGTIWTTITPGFGGSAIILAYGNGLWVVGSSISTKASTNGTTWTSLTQFTDSLASPLRSVSYGNGIWLAGGGGYTTGGELIKVSTNLVNWTTATISESAKASFNGSIYSISYGNNKWLAGGYLGNVLQSTDGYSWTSTSAFFQGVVPVSPLQIIYANGIFLGRGSRNAIIRSTDGISWSRIITQGVSYAPTYTGMDYGEGLWQITTSDYSVDLSTDGLTWTSGSAYIFFQLDKLAYGTSSNLWVAADTWGSLSAGTSVNMLGSISSPGFNPISFLKEQNGIWMVSDVTVKTWVSPNILSEGGGWTTVSLGVVSQFIWGDSKFVAVDGSVKLSTDAIAWTTVNSNLTSASELAYGNGVWVAANSSGDVQISTDAIAWTTAASIPTTSPILSYGNSVWTAVSRTNSTIYYSTDLLSWTTTGVFDKNVISIPNKMKYANGVWVAGSDDGLLLKTTDGNSWSPVALPLSPSAIRSIVYQDNKWAVAVNSSFSSGYVAYSTDTITWTSSNTISGLPRALSYLDGSWILGVQSSSSNQIFSSTNGISWTTTNGLFPNAIMQIETDGISAIAMSETRALLSKKVNASYAAASNESNVFYSTNSVTWTTRQLQTNPSSINFSQTAKINGSLNIPQSDTQIIYGDDGLFLINSKIKNSLTKNINLYNPWTVVGFTSSSTTINHITFDNNLWVAVGSNGQIHHSTNSTTWFTVGTSNFGNSSIEDISYGNGSWVAVGSGGARMARSTNATNWVTVTSNFGNTAILGISYGNGSWVAVGRSTQMRRSTDAITWSTVSISSTTGGYATIQGVRFFNNLWVAPTSSSNSPIITSTDSTTWTARAKGLSTISATAKIAYGGGVWAVAANSTASLRSTNGLDWERVTYPQSIRSIAYGENVWVITVNKNSTFSSTDLVYWTTLTNLSGSTSSGSAAVGYNNGIWLLSSGGDVIRRINSERRSFSFDHKKVVPFFGNAFISLDQNKNIYNVVANSFENPTTTQIDPSWHKINIPYNINNLRYLNNNFAIITSEFNDLSTNSFYLSTNGSSWTSSETGILGNAIGFGAGIWAIGGRYGQMRTSTNAMTWTTVESNFGNTVIRTIDFGNGIWVAGGYSGQIRTSTNGSVWTTVTSNLGTGSIQSINYGNGVWLAGSFAQMRRSTDGSTWVTITHPFGSNWIYDFEFANGIWVAVGATFAAVSSDNGLTWTTRNATFTSSVFDITYGNGVWVASGYRGQVRVSTDTISWATINMVTTSFFRDIAYGNGIWLAGGNGFNQTTLGRRSFSALPLSEKIREIASMSSTPLAFSDSGRTYRIINESTGVVELISSNISDPINKASVSDSGEAIAIGNTAVYYSANANTNSIVWTTISVIEPASNIADIDLT